MTISNAVWTGYIDKLRAINETASQQMLNYMNSHEFETDDELYDLIRFGQGLSNRYGEAAAEVAAEMYDAIVYAEYQAAVEAGAMSTAYKLRHIAEAVPAPTATENEVAKTVVGTLKTGNSNIVASAIGRLVKLAAVDTTLTNALRDGAEFAWIPRGDTCAFCLTLASNGWQKASKKAVANGHASHVHANCDCTYAVRFDKDTEVEGFDNGRKYLSMYNKADPYGKPKDKINAMRREIYAGNKDAVRQYKKPTQIKLLNSSGAELFDVDDWQPALDTPFD